MKFSRLGREPAQEEAESNFEYYQRVFKIAITKAVPWRIALVALLAGCD